MSNYEFKLLRFLRARLSLVSKLVVHSIIGAPSTDQIDYALNYRRTEAAFVLVDFGPNAPLRLRRWLRVKVSGQGPPKPSPAAEAQRYDHRRS